MATKTHSKYLKETDNVVLFWQKTWPSNLHPAKFTDDETGLKFACVEQYLMYRKAMLFAKASNKNADLAKKIMSTEDTKAMKRYGRAVKDYDDTVWNKARDDVIVRGLRLKFGQNPALLELLLATGTKRIAEASPIDSIWGIGMGVDDTRALDPRNWPAGSNLLGRSLETVREEFRQQTTSASSDTT